MSFDCNGILSPARFDCVWIDCPLCKQPLVGVESKLRNLSSTAEMRLGRDGSGHLLALHFEESVTDGNPLLLGFAHPFKPPKEELGGIHSSEIREIDRMQSRHHLQCGQSCSLSLSLSQSPARPLCAS